MTDLATRPPLGQHTRWWPRYRRSIAAIPAIALGALAAAAGLAVLAQQDIEISYSLIAQRHLARSEFREAEVAYARLARIRPGSADYAYGLAKVAAGLGQARRSRAILDTLAPADRPGYPPAQLDLARLLLAGAPPTPEGVRQPESQLLRLLDAEPGSDEACALLGQLYARTGRPALAVPYLRRAVREKPALRFLLAQALASSGQPTPARTEAEQARNDEARRLAADPADVDARLALASALLLLDDQGAAESRLREGLELRDDPRLRRALSSVHVAQADRLVAQGRAQVVAVAEILEKGLHADPGNPLLVDRLTALLRSVGPGADGVRSALQEVLASGKATATVHVVLGIDAWTLGRPAEARVHWEAAYHLDPVMPTVANNLAWSLAQSDAADLPRALALIDPVVRRIPREAAFRHTRGHILLKMGRWNEALTDLEAILPTRPDDPGLHRSLALAYEKLGAHDMAATHRRAAGPTRTTDRADHDEHRATR